MASTEGASSARRSADRCRVQRCGLAVVHRGGMEPERRRLALHAGRGARLRLRRTGRQMAGQLAGLAARPEARLDQHGPGHPGTAAWRRRHGPAEALHRGSAVGRRGRRPRCDGTGSPDLPASGVPRSLRDLTLALRCGHGRGGCASRRHLLAADRGGRPPQARSLRPAADRHGTAGDPRSISPCASPAAPGSPRTLRGRSSGFVLGREGRMATSLGPVVADSEAIALALIAKAAASAPGPFIVDVPDGAPRRARLARGAEGNDAARLHAHDPGRGEGARRSHLMCLLSPAPNLGNHSPGKRRTPRTRLGLLPIASRHPIFRAAPLPRLRLLLPLLLSPLDSPLSSPSPSPPSLLFPRPLPHPFPLAPSLPPGLPPPPPPPPPSPPSPSPFSPVPSFPPVQTNGH